MHTSTSKMVILGQHDLIRHVLRVVKRRFIIAPGQAVAPVVWGLLVGIRGSGDGDRWR